MLLLFFFLFLPLNIQRFPEIVSYLKRHKLSWILIPALYAIYLLTFQPTHPYNQVGYVFFLRNRLLLFMNSTILWKSIFFIPMIYSVFALMVTKLKNRQYYWIYPASIVSLIPSWLIEQRYYLIPFSLFLLMREEGTPTTETLQVALYMPAAIYLLYGITAGNFFL
jgi:alpha-1,2-glucosyltransferase